MPIFFSRNTEALQKCLAPHLGELINFSLSEWGANTLNVMLTDNDKDFALFEHDLNRVYCGHIFCQDKTGKEVLTFAKQALTFFFDNTDAEAVHGLTPVEKRHVSLFIRKVGFTSYGVIQTEAGMMEHFILTKNEWRTLNG